MSNETDTVSKVERLRQTQQTEAAKAMDRAEGVLAPVARDSRCSDCGQSQGANDPRERR
jgi:hypothetical protein